MPRNASITALVSVALMICLIATGGCARRAPYRLGTESEYRTTEELRDVTHPQIERGSPRLFLDGLGWFIGIPGKITLWDRRIDNHHISPTTEAAVAQYLAMNELSTVKVRLNQYAPRDEWRRLTRNRSVSWGWRYSLGTLSWLGYTIFPGRVWGGDNYNPFTNTISLYSDAPAVALHEAGHAKDFSRRNYPGTYAAVYNLPIVPLWHEATATRDALDYLHEFGSVDEQREAYELLYPAYGTYVGGAVGDLVPGYGLAAYAAAVVGGHAIGRFQASRIQPVETPPAVTTERQPPPAVEPDFEPFEQPRGVEQQAELPGLR